MPIIGLTIRGGKKLYKHYKSVQEAKKAELAAQSSNHDRLLMNGPSSSPSLSTPNLNSPRTSTTSVPPPYDSLSPQSPADGATLAVPNQYQQYLTPEQYATAKEIQIQSNMAMPPQTQQMPMQTAPVPPANGRWVWVAEDGTLVTPPAAPNELPTTPAPAPTSDPKARLEAPPSFAVELPAFNEPKEMAVEGMVPVEIDGTMVEEGEEDVEEEGEAQRPAPLRVPAKEFVVS